jgi:K(+)-stimulated pyrophosphate-energized sodium pump
VGKVEAGIPEDDPRNAATIADNVGDNVGDCAGMAADLFESYAVTLVAALILGQVFFGPVGMVFPLVVAAIGVLASVAGILATRPSDKDSSGLAPINRGFFVSALVSLALVAVAAFTVLPGGATTSTTCRSARRCWASSPCSSGSCWPPPSSSSPATSPRPAASRSRTSAAAR